MQEFDPGLLPYPPWQTPVRLAAGLLFEALVRLRNGFYDASGAGRLRLPHPVVSVGNITLGGTGKTPMVIYLARRIAGMGLSPVLLSRGYGRTGRGPVIVPPGGGALPSARLIGDEPALARRHEPRLWLGISRDRHAVGLQIAGRAAQPCFILDDGFQHRRLHRNLDLVLIDRTQPFGRNRIVPRGTLREPVSGLRRAGVVMINGIPAGGTDPLVPAIRAINPDAAVCQFEQQIESLVPFARWRSAQPAGEPWPAGMPVFLVAAIGNPRRFRRDVENLGVEVRGARFFRDHYRLRPQDLQSLLEELPRCGAKALVTTEKDAVKLPENLDLPLVVSVQSTRVVEAEQFHRKLSGVLDSR